MSTGFVRSSALAFLCRSGAILVLSGAGCVRSVPYPWIDASWENPCPTELVTVPAGSALPEFGPDANAGWVLLPPEEAPDVAPITLTWTAPAWRSGWFLQRGAAGREADCPQVPEEYWRTVQVLGFADGDPLGAKHLTYMVPVDALDVLTVRIDMETTGAFSAEGHPIVEGGDVSDVPAFADMLDTWTAGEGWDGEMVSAGLSAVWPVSWYLAAEVLMPESHVSASLDGEVAPLGVVTDP